MSIFDKILKENETLFLNELALSYEFIPKLIPYREPQQKRIASCMAPLFQDHNGRNIIVYGPPGVGKTVATKHILNELEEKATDIVPIYINCWQNNTSYKITLAICEFIEYKFTHNKNTSELFDIIANRLNKVKTVFVFDEIDKCEDFDYLYLILQKIHTKSVVILTNFKEFIADIDIRIRSRLLPELLEFKPYNQIEIEGILKQRTDLAFMKGTWNNDAFIHVVEQTTLRNDVRVGLYLLHESGLCAEEESSKTIALKHVLKAQQKLDEFKIKNVEELPDDNQQILQVLKKQTQEIKIGDLFKLFCEETKSEMSYKTFTRKIAKLEEAKFITVRKTEGGSEGNTKFILYNTQAQYDASPKETTLSDFE
jgi:archaeal cell division control protein 6